MVEELGYRAVGGKLHGGVADVEHLGGDVALPEAGETFMVEDMADCWQRAFVDWRAPEVGLGEG